MCVCFLFCPVKLTEMKVSSERVIIECMEYYGKRKFKECHVQERI